MFHQKFDGNLCYFMGCPHWGHKNICKGVSVWSSGGMRDFATVKEMNLAITQSVLNTVPENAYLFLLGDILFGDKTQLASLMQELRPRTLVLILGNHCDFIRKNKEYQTLFDYVGEYLEIYCSKPNGGYSLCCLFHYPIKSWRDEHHGSYCLTSHSHGNLPYDENEKAMDVGWDVWKKPISFVQIHKLFANKKFVAKDHHS